MKRCAKIWATGSAMAIGAMGAMTAPAPASFTLPIAIYNNADAASLAGLAVSVNVSDGGSFAIFSIQNHSSGVNAGAVVTSIYFESSAFSISSLAAGAFMPFDPGVNYLVGATPTSPASGMSPSWGGNLFSGRPSSPAPSNGVGSGEQVSVSFGYIGGMDFATLQAVLLGNPNAFRVAMHIQSVGVNGGSSVWGVTVPSPGAMALLGLAGLVGLGRRRAH